MGNKNSNHWRRSQSKDPYVQQARKLGYRSRAAFKLIEIQDKNQIIQSGMKVLDLGAAPGGWSQQAIRWVGRTGEVIAIDLLDMQPIPGVQFIQGDAFTPEVQAQLAALGPFDVLISDIAPNTTGIKDVDQLRSLGLAESALFCAHKLLKPGGHFCVKIFQGAGFDGLLLDLRRDFEKVYVRKPAASRADSKESFLLATNLL